MRKTVFKLFIDSIDKQEKWLNEMADGGFRLTGCNRLSYEFEDCAPGEYRYGVRFVHDKAAPRQSLKRRLEGKGYRVYNKPLNFNWLFGTMDLRSLFGAENKTGAQQTAEKKELLLVEKRNDDAPFDFRNDAETVFSHYKIFRNSCVGITVVVMILAAQSVATIFTRFDFSWGLFPPLYSLVFYTALSLVLTAVSINLIHVTKRYTQKGGAKHGA